jgi:hypothetical protein
MERENDNPELRSGRLNDRLGIVSPFVFSRNLDDAINHAAVPARADATVRAWVPMGPRNIGGRIGVIVQDPRNPSVLYAGSGIGGVWKSTDSGDTWMPLDNFSPPAGVRQALPIGAIAVSRSNPQIVYVGTGEPTMGANNNDFELAGFGLYRSADGGASFVNIDDVDSGTMKATRFERILVDPWEADRCWIASPTGLWRREPGGALTQDPVGTPPAASQIISDVVIDFRGDLTGAPPGTFMVYVAVRAIGIYRRVFDRATHAYIGSWVKLDRGIGESNFDRIKLALCAAEPTVLYSVFGLADSAASRVYRTANRGDQWERTSERPDDSGKQAYYDLVLEVHPKRPELVFTGSVELWRTQNSGERWEKVLDWTNYDAGDRAQHADQHTFLFDAARDGTVWLGNDGGISRSRNLGNTWRKKSYGILATQFYDITVHPTYPWVTGGGLQDNGSWVGLGGPTWFHLFGGDGGALVFEPANLQRFIVTWQGPPSGNEGLVRCDIENVNEAPGLNRDTEYKSPLPDLVTFHPGDTLTLKKFRSKNTDLTDGISGSNHATFTGVVEHHPSTANHFLVGRKGAGYLTTDGSQFTKQATGNFAGENPEVSAVAYAPSAANTNWWITTSQGEVFTTPDAGANWNNVTPPDLAAAIAAVPAGGQTGVWVTDVAVHPANLSIVALTVAGGVRGVGALGGRVYLTGDNGTTWKEMSGRTGAPNGVSAVAADRLNPSAAMCVAFDPNTPNAGAQTLYVGTLAGVHVIRNATPPTAAAPNPPAPVWRTFNNNLPLTLIYDIVPVVVRDAANNVVRTALRCGTHGRGIWECDLAGAPRVRLFIRNTPIDDGFFYSGTAGVATDPRLVPAPALRFDRGFDVRVAAPPFADVEGSIDSAEFDEMVVNVVPVAGVKNPVFVQVHTAGHVDNLADVRVQLYFADAPNEPPAVPDLQADFWTAFPGDPPAGAWRKAATEFVRGLGPAQPVVARLEWIPPLDVGPQVALLAVCTRTPSAVGDTNVDDLKAAAPTLVMNPANAASLVRTERRAALRVTAVDSSFPTVFVRDAANDAGLPGSVAWGGRSPDIIVRPGAEADPDTAFADLGDSRFDDVVIGNTTNHIYVRVSNRLDLELSADVELYRAPHDTLDQPATWTQIGAATTLNAIAPRSSKLTPAFELPNPPDPAPGVDYKVMMLIAVVYRSGTASPPRDSITDLSTFWRFLIHGRAPHTDMSAACRGLRWKAQL